MRPRQCHRVAVIASTLALMPVSLCAETVEDFYKGKQVRIITGANAGNGYDLWSRFLARHIGRHIPGRPSIIVQNMPGAGTLTAANYIFNVAARDGTIIGSFSRSLPSQAVLNRPNIRFDPRQFGWIGSPETINRVCAVGAASAARSIDDVFAREVLVGGMGATMVPSYMPTLLNRLLGTRFRVV